MPFKVIQGHLGYLGTNGKPMSDFLLVINTISHRFQVFADYWSNLRFRQGVPHFNTLVRNTALMCGGKSVSIS